MKLSRKVLYEVDGGDRSKVKSFKISVQPAAITVCLPKKESSSNGNMQNDSGVSPPSAHAAGEGFVASPLYPILSRAGFVARA